MTADDQSTSETQGTAEGDIGASSRAWLKRPAVWIGTVATAVIIAVASSLAVTYANHAASNLNSHNSGLPIKVLAVTLERNAAFQGYSFVFARPIVFTSSQLTHMSNLAKSSNLNGLSNYYAWARASGGVDPGTLIMQLVLAGNRGDVVRILNMHAVGLCTAPLTGTLLYSPGAAQDNNVAVGLNLEQRDPVAQVIKGNSSFGPDYFTYKTVSLMYNEQQVFTIVAVTSKHYCQFRLDFTVLADGKTSDVIVGEGAKPFKVSAVILGPNYNSVKAYKRVYIGGVTDATCGGQFMNVQPSNFSFYPPPKC
jgi:hypothetical protein